MSFEDDLKAEFEAERATKDVDVKLNGNLYTFRFTQMDAQDWVLATDRATPRVGVLIDARYGYNPRALVPLVAPKYGKRVDGDNLVDLTEDQWRNLLKALPGAYAARIADAIFDLNEWEPAQAVAELKKASGAAFGIKSA